jgi:uncharacterized damage-inducible protein DinB
MKQYLIDFFKYNDWANRRILESMKQMPDSGEAAQMFGHMAFSYLKWLNRITNEVPDSSLSWAASTPPLDKLESYWAEGVQKWLKFIENLPEQEFERQIEFVRPTDNKRMGVKLLHIALQINYHQIHHRAQIARMIRQQGLTPPPTDFIFTVFKEL